MGGRGGRGGGVGGGGAFSKVCSKDFSTPGLHGGPHMYTHHYIFALFSTRSAIFIGVTSQIFLYKGAKKPNVIARWYPIVCHVLKLKVWAPNMGP